MTQGELRPAGGFVTAIILAGGGSTRFGGDKLAADLDGRTVLSSTIASVLPLVDGVIVAGPRLPAGFVADEIPVALIPDAAAPAGPLAALSNVLSQWDAQPGDLAIVLGGDMPRVVPGVLAAMLTVLRKDPRAGVALLGRPERPFGPDAQARQPVLPMALRMEPAAHAARQAFESGEQSLRSFVDRLSLRELPASTWMELDPDASTLLDVDTRSDLERIRQHGT